MKVLLVGGGTGGPTAPLLAVKEEISKLKSGVKFFFIGTSSHIDNILVDASMPFYKITAGKWRRYWSLKNFTDFFLTFFGFLKSLYLIKKIKPNVIFSAGSYASVPVAYAAYLLRKKIIIHQQDYYPSLSNRLIAPVADKITVSLEKSTRDFSANSGLFRNRPAASKVILTGNPVRPQITRGDRKTAKKIFNLNENFPSLLILGGGSGSLALNNIIGQTLNDLSNFFQIIHVTGKKNVSHKNNIQNYHPYQFLKSEMPHALAVADIVISRAGFSTISELAACRKVSIIIPLPNSHQIYNAQLLLMHRAAIVLNEKKLSPQLILDVCRKLMFQRDFQEMLKKNISQIMPSNSAHKIAKIILAV